MKALMITALFLTFVAPTAMAAETAFGKWLESAKPSHYRDVSYVELEYLKVKESDRFLIQQLIRDVFVPAAKRAGISQPRVQMSRTGEWDFMIMWPLANGPEDLTWALDKKLLTLYRTMVEQHGEAKTKEFLDTYEAAIVDSNSQLSMQLDFGTEGH